MIVCRHILLVKINIHKKAQSQQASAKLVEMFEELTFWREEVEFFSWPCVYFGLRFLYESRC